MDHDWELPSMLPAVKMPKKGKWEGPYDLPRTKEDDEQAELLRKAVEKVKLVAAMGDWGLKDDEEDKESASLVESIKARVRRLAAEKADREGTVATLHKALASGKGMSATMTPGRASGTISSTDGIVTLPGGGRVKSRTVSKQVEAAQQAVKDTKETAFVLRDLREQIYNERYLHDASPEPADGG